MKVRNPKMKLTAREILKLYKKEYKPKPVSGYVRMTQFSSEVVELWKRGFVRVGERMMPSTVENIAWALGSSTGSVIRALSFYEANYGSNSESKIIIKDEIDTPVTLGSKRESYYNNELEYGNMNRMYKYSDVIKEIETN